MLNCSNKAKQLEKNIRDKLQFMRKKSVIYEDLQIST